MKCRLNQSLWKVSNSFSKKKCCCVCVHLLLVYYCYQIISWIASLHTSFFFNIGNFLPLQSFFFTFSSYVQVNDDLIFFRVSFLIFLFFMTACLKKIIDRCHYVLSIKPLWHHLNLEELFNIGPAYFLYISAMDVNKIGTRR